MNPYQGLKPQGNTDRRSKSDAVLINMNPYQGLKLLLCLPIQVHYPRQVLINMNPYQGLKRGELAILLNL